MKPNIHPNYQALELIMTNGDKFTTSSTSSEKKLILDMDMHNHPAWKGGVVGALNTKIGKVAKFNDKFASFNMFVDSKKDDSK